MKLFSIPFIVIAWLVIAVFLPAYVDKEILPDVWIPTSLDGPGHFVWWMFPQAVSLVVWFVLVTIGFIFLLSKIFNPKT